MKVLVFDTETTGLPERGTHLYRDGEMASYCSDKLDNI